MKFLKRLRRKEERVEIRNVLEKAMRGEILSYEEVMSLLDSAELKLSREPQLIKLKGKTVFIGDTHGDLDTSISALRFLKEGYNLVFLGDYVDRGAKQIENINYLLANYISGNLFLLRGNHESPVVNMNYGFMEVLYHVYGSEWQYVYMRYNEVFSNLPYAALVDGILALHGGIAEGLKSIKQIVALPKKDLIPSNKIAFQILWNDPSESVERFGENYSRGGGVKYYGRVAIGEFLRVNKLKAIVRSHEAYPDGYMLLFEGDTGVEGMKHRLISIFSCRYYGIPPTAAMYDGKRMEVIRI